MPRPSRTKEAQALYRLKNREKIRAYQREYNAAHPEKKRKWQTDYATRNHESLLEKGREAARLWRRNNPEKSRLSVQQSALKNKERVTRSFSEWRTSAFENNHGYKALHNLRSRLNRLLRSSGGVKRERLSSLIGCSSKELSTHLESMFQPGMSWDSYGVHGWHIDHIKPCASFDLTDPEQQKICFHFSNLQPMWALDNIRKGAKPWVQNRKE